MFVRLKKTEKYEYLQIVENKKREKPRSSVFSYLLVEPTNRELNLKLSSY